MTQPLNPASAWKILSLSAVLIPLMASAQSAPMGTEKGWREANDSVGELQRGHIDVLKWEAANQPSTSKVRTEATDGLPLQSIEDVTRQVWLAHLGLAAPLASLGTTNVEKLKLDRWTELDPSLHRRVGEFAEILQVAAHAKKAWLRAIAAHQVLAPYRAALQAADAASELGQRMVNVGNWSRLKQTQLQLAQSSARRDLLHAEYAARQAQVNLIDELKLKGQYASIVLPDRLPDVPDRLMPLNLLQPRALAVQAQLPGAEARRNRANTELALAAYQVSHELLTIAREGVLKTRDFIGEETVLHYNGMLASVWDLLDESRNRSRAVIDAIDAQRDFLIAEADLQWVLLGGEPDSFVSLGGGAESATAAGH